MNDHLDIVLLHYRFGIVYFLVFLVSPLFVKFSIPLSIKRFPGDFHCREDPLEVKTLGTKLYRNGISFVGISNRMKELLPVYFHMNCTSR